MAKKFSATVKILEALACGTPVVTMEWVVAVEKCIAVLSAGSTTDLVGKTSLQLPDCTKYVYALVMVYLYLI